MDANPVDGTHRIEAGRGVAVDGDSAELRYLAAGQAGADESPIVLLHDREDPIFPVALSERTAERIPESECEIISSAGSSSRLPRRGGRPPRHRWRSRRRS